MGSSATNGTYPRSLRPKERDLLELVLPTDRAGYRRYRELIGGMIVIGEGRRGPGNYVLGDPGDVPDLGGPLAPVLAFGIVESTRDMFTITVRECVGRQIDVELVSTRGAVVPDHFEEKRRWTYSTWRPGEPSPSNGLPVREVRIDTNLTLTVSRQERRLWLYDKRTGVNHLLPITNFHNELMLVKRIRDPKVALESALFFRDLVRYSDDDLRAAFVAYNRLRPRVDVHDVPSHQTRALRSLLRRFLEKAS